MYRAVVNETEKATLANNGILVNTISDVDTVDIHRRIVDEASLVRQKMNNVAIL